MAAVLWSVHRRPGPRLLAWTALLALALALVTAWLLPRLMLEPEPWCGWLAGTILAAALLASLWQGSTTRVEADGTLVYALRGVDCVRLDLARVAGVRPVAAGLLAGAGIDCPLDALVFLSRKGPSRRLCERTHRDLGASLVLEFLRPEDAADLDRLRRRFALAEAPPAHSVPP